MTTSVANWTVDPFVRYFVARKVKEITERGRRAGFEPEDIRSELLANLWRRRAKFNPARSRWTTFVRLVTEHHVADLVARWSRSGPPRRMLSEAEGTDAALHQGTHLHGRGTSGSDPLTVWQRSADLSDVLGRLTQADRRLCHELSLRPVAEVARKLGCSRTTVYRRIHRIRRVFERADMGAYL